MDFLFYLVRMYGDVPLILAETDASTYMPRTAVAEIYDQAIIPSLKKSSRKYYRQKVAAASALLLPNGQPKLVWQTLT